MSGHLTNLSHLQPEQQAILCHEGTEQPWSSPLNEEQREGIFCCAGCGTPLFTSAMKFDSGSGWPSFNQVIEGAIATQLDTRHGMTRTEYHCAHCGGHHGHLFNDGPAPTGLRYCNNGLSLQFIPNR